MTKKIVLTSAIALLFTINSKAQFTSKEKFTQQVIKLVQQKDTAALSKLYNYEGMNDETKMLLLWTKYALVGMQKPTIVDQRFSSEDQITKAKKELGPLLMYNIEPVGQVFVKSPKGSGGVMLVYGLKNGEYQLAGIVKSTKEFKHGPHVGFAVDIQHELGSPDAMYECKCIYMEGDEEKVKNFTGPLDESFSWSPQYIKSCELTVPDGQSVCLKIRTKENDQEKEIFSECTTNEKRKITYKK